MTFPTPFAAHAEPVQPEWIDYNGHMNLAYYILVFDHATDVLFEALGLGAAYRQATNFTLFAVELHTLYEREVGVGSLLRVESRLLGVDGKRLHFGHEMRHAEEGWRAATTELMAIHVDLATRRTAPFPEDRGNMLHQVLADHSALPPADWAGRRIGLPDRRV